MKKLFQAVDVETCHTLFKKGMASLIILSMLMGDVVNAMEEEHDPLSIQRALSPSPREINNVSKSYANSNPSAVDPSELHRLEGADHETPTTVEGGYASIPPSQSIDQSSHNSSKSTASVPDFILSPPNPELSEESNEIDSAEYADGSLKSPFVNSTPSHLMSESHDGFKPSATGAATGPFERERRDDANGEILLTIEEYYPQLQLSGSIGSSPTRAASLQERSSPFILRSKSVAEGSHNNSNPLTSPPHFVRSHSLELGSETDSDEETEGSQMFLSLERRQDTPPTHRIPIIKSKKSSVPPDEKSRLLQSGTVNQRYSIQAGEESDAPPSSRGRGRDPDELESGWLLMDHHPDIEEEGSKCCSCCPTNRPLWPQHTEYTLRGAVTPDEVLDKVRNRSELLTAHPSDHHSVSSNDSSDSLSSDESDPSSSDGSPSKAVQRDRVLLPLDEDFEVEERRPILTLQSDSEGSHVFPVLSPHPVDQDLEDGGGLPAAPFIGPLPPQEAWKYFLDDLKGLPAEAKTQLVNFTHQILNGKSTWPQRLEKWIVGPIIGGGFAWAMGPVYDGGVGYLSTQSEALKQFIIGSGFQYFIDYIMLSAIPDGVSRNAHLWKKGIGYLFQEGKEKGRMCLAGFISTLTACIPLAYLISAENVGRQLSGDTNWDNGFGVIIAVFGPPIYLDALASDFNIAWFALPQMQEWLGKFWCRPSSRAQLPVFLDAPRERFNNNLKSLEHFLYRAPQAVIDEIYNTIKQVKESVQVPRCGNYDEALASQQAFAVLSYLLSLGDDVVQGVSKPKSIYDIAADVFKYACLILGSPARAVALQFIGYSVFSLFCSDPIAQILGGIYALLAFLPQTFMEDQGMDNFFKHFLVTEEPDGYKAHSICRGVAQLFCSLQGLIYVLPLAVTTLEAFQQWTGGGWWPLVVSIPFLIPEGAAQIYSFNGTYNQLVVTSAINGGHKIGSKCKGGSLCSTCKKDWLIRFVQESQKSLPHWDNEFVNKLLEGVKLFKEQD